MSLSLVPAHLHISREPLKNSRLFSLFLSLPLLPFAHVEPMGVDALEESHRGSLGGRVFLSVQAG